jgi:hypothetical protein
VRSFDNGYMRSWRACSKGSTALLALIISDAVLAQPLDGTDAAAGATLRMGVRIGV